MVRVIQAGLEMLVLHCCLLLCALDVGYASVKEAGAASHKS